MQQSVHKGLSLKPGAAGVGSLRPAVLKYAPLRVPFACRQTRRCTVKVDARLSSGGRSPDAIDRVLAALPYILPLFNSMQYGRFLFYMYPAVKTAITPLIPALSFYNSLPFGSVIAFFTIYLGLVNNKSWSRFVRFNAMQAILLDILLVLPRLVESVVTPPSSGWGLDIYVQCHSFIWIFIVIWVLYGVGSSLLGNLARIPFLGDAADQQIM